MKDREIEGMRRYGESLITMQIERFAQERMVRLDRDAIEVRSLVEYATRDLVFSLLYSVCSGGKAVKVVKFDVPENWFEAWKLEVLSRYRRFRLVKWALRRWPIRYQELAETVEAHALFPTVPLRLNEHKVEFMFSRNHIGGLG